MKPWEKYQDKKPWEKYGETPEPADNEGFSVREMAENIPSSAVKLGKDMAYPFMHPVQTAKGAGSIYSGAGQTLSDKAKEYLPDNLDFLAFSPVGAITDAMGSDNRPVVDALIEAIKNRYGSSSAALNTLEKDPVGAVADLASVLTGTGAIKMGAAANPINIAKNATFHGAGKMLPKNMPKGMYEDVAKFSTAIPGKDRAKMIDTAIKHRVLPTGKGVQKLENMISGLNSKLDDLISAAADSGKTIPKEAVYRHLKELRQQKGGVRLGAADDLDQINKIVGEFDQHLKSINKAQLTPKDLQKMKVEAYKSINWDAKRATGTPIKEDVYKTVARGAKDSIEDVVPDVKPVNKQLGELYDLQPALQRSANRIDQRNMIPIDAPLQVGVGSGLGGDVGAVAGGISAFLGLPQVKARTAFGLQNLIDNAGLSRYISRNNPALSAAELAAILLGRQGQSNEQTATPR